MNSFDYVSDWSEYAYPETNDITFESTIKSVYRKVDLRAKKFAAGGIPILVKDNIAYLNDADQNTLIFGQTGSKKTRSAIGPMIIMAAGAGESSFVTDVKGELSSNPKIMGFLADHGVNTVLIDFRTFDKDGFNILEHAYKQYKAGNKEKAMAECAVLLNMLGLKYERGAKDPFWHGNAKQYLRPLLEMVFRMGVETGCDEKVNLLSLSSLSNRSTSDVIGGIFKQTPEVFFEKLMPNNVASLRTVVDNPPNTMANILSTVQTMLEEFTLQPDLTRMLSKTTFDVASMYEKPTCVFLIVPDETSAYDATAGMLIDNFYNTLIETYGKQYMNKHEPKCRINFICDEFCNLSVNDMKAKISASRGRAMRWYLVCQSLNQLETTYGSAAGTIIGNCQNTLFLQSCDESLLDYICRLCGTTEISRSGSERLVTPEMLKSLRKERSYKEALYINEQVHFFAKLPDIDSYDFLNKYNSRTNRGCSSGKNYFGDLSEFNANDIRSVFSLSEKTQLDFDDFDYYEAEEEDCDDEDYEQPCDDEEELFADRYDYEDYEPIYLFDDEDDNDGLVESDCGWFDGSESDDDNSDDDSDDNSDDNSDE